MIAVLGDNPDGGHGSISPDLVTTDVGDDHELVDAVGGGGTGGRIGGGTAGDVGGVWA